MTFPYRIGLKYEKNALNPNVITSGQTLYSEEIS